MGFSWTEDISIGATIDSDDIQEVRDNVDWLDDNKCNTDNTDYRSSFAYNEDGVEFASVNSSDFDSVDTTYNQYEVATFNQAHQEAHNSGDNINEKSYECGTYCNVEDTYTNFYV